MPHPAKTGRFYIFSNTAHQGAKWFPNLKQDWGGLYFSELYKDSTDEWVFDHENMNVEVKNLDGVPIIGYQQDSAILVKEYMTAIPKCDNNGYWLVVVADDHPDLGSEYINNNKLLILSVDTNGISLHDTLSLPILQHDTILFVGVAKFSPDGSMLALLNYLIDFDRLKGKATIRYEFNSELSFGLCFSKNSQLLYFTESNRDEVSFYQLQTDLNNPNKKVKIGRIELPGIKERSNYQLAPDGKIYITSYDDDDIGFPFINTINNPDVVQGPNDMNTVEFEAFSVPLHLSNVGGFAMDGLPNFVDAGKYSKEQTSISISPDSCTTYHFRAKACCASSYKWYFGDGDSAVGVTATHDYEAGVYDVMLIADNDTIHESIQVGNFSVQISGPDTICPRSPGPEYSMVVTQSSNPSWNEYEWQLIDGNMPNADKQTTNVEILGETATLFAKVTSIETGCVAYDTMTITRFTTLGNNIINNNEYLHIFCSSDTGTFLVEGSLPTGGDSNYYYTWNVWDNWNNKLYGDSQNLKLNAWVHDTLFAYRDVMSEGCYDRSDTIMLIPNMRENIVNNGADSLLIFDYVSDSMLFISGNETEGTSTISYKWFYSTDSTDWHEVTGQTDIDLEHDTFSGYRWFFRNTFIDDCYKRSNIVKVYPKVWNNEIGDTSVYHYCSSDNIQLLGSSPVGGIETYTYQWFISIDGSEWNAIEGATHKNLNVAGGYPPIRYFKRRVYSGLDSIESNSVQFIHTIRNNSISPASISTTSFTNNQMYVCANSINNIQFNGSNPTLYSGTPNYQWYISKDSIHFEAMEGKTSSSLTMKAEDSTAFVYREISVSGCISKSNTIKMIHLFGKNEIQANLCYDGSFLDITGNYSPAILNSSQSWFRSYYTNWQNVSFIPITFQADTLFTESDSVKTKFISYESPIDSVEYFRRNNIVRIYMHSTATYKYCYHFSPVIEVYNPYYLNQIEINPSDVITGKMPLPDGSYAAVWQKNCNNQGWEDITSFESEDELNNIVNFECCEIRRFLTPLNSEGVPLNCDTFYSNTLLIEGGYITSQPLTQTVSIGDNASFSIDYNSNPVFDIQWQKFNSHTSIWDDMENEHSSDLIVYAEKCSDGDLYRAVLTNECRTLFSDSAELVLNKNNDNFFLWLKDLPSDTAEQPNSYLVNGASHFNSPDIRPYHSSIISIFPPYSPVLSYLGLFVHTEIRNKGTDTSRGGKLFLYASVSGLNPEWDFSFTDDFRVVTLDSFGVFMSLNTFKNPDPQYNDVTLGTAINTEGIEIPPIPPGNSVILTYHWSNPPDHFLPFAIKMGGVPLDNQSDRSIIYLARIEECSEFPHDMTFEEEIFGYNGVKNSTRTNIRNNARIAALHSHIVPPHPPIATIPLNERGPSLVSTVGNVVPNTPITIDIDIDSADHFFSNAELYVYFDDVLWDAFANGGYDGSGYTVISPGVFRIDTSIYDVYWNNIMLDVDTFGHIGYSCYYKYGADTSGVPIESMFRVVFSQLQVELGEMYLYVDSKSSNPLGIVVHEKELEQADTIHNNKIRGVQAANTIDQDNTSIPLTLTAYPNPFNKELFVFVANFDPNSTITMLDMNSKELYSFKLPNKPSPAGHTITIPTTYLATGVYLIRYQSGSQTIVKKVVLLR